MRILVLCEGDAETHDSWSGISKSVVQNLRAAGHEVLAKDTDLYGVLKYVQLIRSFSPNRRRWWVKYHLGESAFRARTRVAHRHIKRASGSIDVVLQFGATFAPPPTGGPPVVLYCDSNIAMARIGASTGVTEASPLKADEVDAIFEREATVYRACDAIMTFSEFVKGTFVSEFGLDPGKVIPVGAGPNLDVTRLGSRDTGPPAPPTILFVGRQFERKGGDLLLAAFRAVRSQVPEARLLIVGPTSLGNELEDGVEFVGFLNKDDPADAERLLRAYASADVFCLPTRFEPFGVAFLEAMRFGVPCVGPWAWAVPEMVEDGETGILVPPEDVLALSDALVRLLGDPLLAERMGEAGRKRAEAYFGWSTIAKRMENVLQSVLD